MKMNIFKVMTDPRGFMKSLKADRMGKMPLYLAWVIGMCYLLTRAQSLQLSQLYAYGYVVLVAAILAIPVGYLMMYVSSFFIYWAGKIFKGKASYLQLFSANAYAKVPEMFVLISWAILVVVLGPVAFMQSGLYVQLPVFVMVMLVLQLFFQVWAFIISLHTIGQVQGFSAWMALWNIIIAFVIIFFIDLFILFLLQLVLSTNTTQVSTLISIINTFTVGV